MFDFSEAFASNQEWLANIPNDISAQCDFAEKHFTVGRFVECEKRIATLLANPEIRSRVKIALSAIQIANLLALNHAKSVSAKLDTLYSTIASEPDVFKVGWTFNGTKHFVSTNDKLTHHREWLLQLFQALEINEGREAILAALQEVRKNWLALTTK